MLTYMQLARFWAKVDLESPLHGCWLWVGAKIHGYGQFRVGKKRMVATHVSLMIHQRPLPGKYQMVIHTCDNPACVNPKHLRIGTALDNARDAQKKGRLKKYFRK